MLVVLRTAPRIVPFFPADIAGVSPESAHSGMLLPALGTLRVTIVVSLIAPVVPFLREISLLALVIEIPLPIVLSGWPV